MLFTRIVVLSILVGLSFFDVKSQAVTKYMFGFGHGGGIPMGDLKTRFGNQFESTFGIYRYGLKKDWIVGIEANIFYGKVVKEDVLAPLRVDDNPLLGINETFSSILLRERGSSGYLTVEKVFSFQEESTHRGLKIGLGAGLMQHFVRIQDDTQNNSYLQGDYIKGFDRFTFGPAIKQAVGYHFYSDAFTYNFSLMLEFEQGFTKNIRNVNFDTMMQDSARRLDMMINLKAKFYIVAFSSGDAEDIYY